MDPGQRLQTLRTIQRALDEAFRVPGTRIRFGWDSLIGLVPWAGDAVTALLACAIVVQAHKMRVPRVVQFRMLSNIAVDLVVGMVPIAGDVADVFWKANSRNMALLERHARAPRPASLGDWLFVAALLTAIATLAAIPLLFLLALFGLLRRAWL